MEVADESDALIETLKSRGWCFRDLEEIKTTIMIQSAILGDTCTVDSLESELANMDFRSIGGISLPDPSVLRKSSSLVGPKVLQISSVRDISRSSIEEYSKSSHNRRLFKLNLTDGHSEITAVEYAHIPSIPDDVIPGTKVCLQSKAAIRNGLVCLNPKVITVIGGVVQTLYEEWQMNKKYSGLSRSSLRVSLEGDTDGPPPFEKFQIGRASHNLPLQDYSGSTSQSTKDAVDPAGTSEIKQFGKHSNLDLKDQLDDLKKDSSSGRIEEKPSTSDMRPKEVVECNPIQNQAASQKLLQKMNYPNRDDRPFRGRKQKGKGKEEERATFTLAEWEKQKSEAKPPFRANNPEVESKWGRKGKQEELPNMTLPEWERRKPEVKPLIRANNPDIYRDEDLAWQLQNQFDLEENVERGPHEANAETIKMSMFSYERDGEGAHGAGYRGRGRGRGRGGGGRGRGKGHGRGSGRGRYD